MAKSRISKVTTRTGDSGQTKLATGRTIQKHSQYVRAIGAVDELNSHIGLALTTLHSGDPALNNLTKTLKATQQALFDIGAVLAMEGVYEAPNWQVLETTTEEMNKLLPPLTEFVLPGGNMASAQLHICRTVGRRTETEVWSLLDDWQEAPTSLSECAQYLNRLSDLFFVAARYANDLTEEQWRGPSEQD